MTYEVIVDKDARKYLNGLRKKEADNIWKRLYLLADNPHPQGSIKLQGEDKTYRLRYGNYRIVYKVENLQLIVYVIGIGHRKDIYKK